MNIRACLFDIGNVLVTFDYTRTFPALAGRTGRRCEDIHAYLAGMSTDLESGCLSSDEFVTRALTFMGGDVTRAGFLTAFTEIFAPITPVWDMVQTVCQRVPVHLFSNTSELHESYLLNSYPDFSWFAGGFYSWRLGVMKPDAAMYHAALESLTLPADQVVYVDDLPANVETGRSLGLHCHLFDRTRPEDLHTFLTDFMLL
jgi:FMN phosphatase YigB (HAD superfamily)